MGTVFELSTEALAGALREGARGYFPLEAGVELLIAHGVWLRRRDFRSFVAYTPDMGASYDRPPMAFVAWADAVLGELPASSSDSAVLRIAASLADDVPVWLRTAVSGLDETNLGLVLDAITWANRGGDPR